jgi:hypothetical protein
MTAGESVHAAVQNNVNKEQAGVALAGLKDAAFSCLFALNSLAVLGLCMSYGVAALNGPEPDKKSISADGDAEDSSSHRRDAIVWLGGVCLMTLLASVLSILYVYAISSLTARSVSCTMYTVGAGTAACAAFLLVVGNVVGGVLALVLLAASFVFYWSVRDRLALAAVNMRTAGVAVTAMPSLFSYAYGIMLLAILWVFVWTLAVYGVATNEVGLL